MIREATVDDIPRLVELGTLSLKTGPYKNRIKNKPEQSARLAHQLLDPRDEGNPEAPGKVLVIDHNGLVVGLLALAFFPDYFTGEKTASEVMWFIHKEYRESIGFDAIALFRAGERAAREAGCVRLIFTAPTEDIAKLYEATGFTALEVSFYKDL